MNQLLLEPVSYTHLKRLADKQLKCELTERAKDYIVETGYDPAFGARPLKRLVQRDIETLLARKIIAGDIDQGTTLVVDVENGEYSITAKSVSYTHLDVYKRQIRHYLDKYNECHFRNHTLSEDAMEILLRYKWPGNVRELSHVMEKVVVLTNGKEIKAENLPKMIFDIGENKYEEKQDITSEKKSLREALEDVERKMVQEAYQKYQNSVKVAQALGVSQPTAYRLIKKYIP